MRRASNRRHGLNTSVQEAMKLSFSRENLDRLDRHISRLNEIIARQRPARGGWDGPALSLLGEMSTAAAMGTDPEANGAR